VLLEEPEYGLHIPQMQIGKFSVMYKDAPWWYANRLTGKGRTKFGGGADGHYNTMKDADLWAIGPGVVDVLADRAVVFAWVTGPRLDFAMDMYRAWGLKYCTIAFSWIKMTSTGKYRANPGHYTGSNKEDVLLFTYNRKGVTGKLTPKRCGGRRMTPQVYNEADYAFEDWELDLIKSVQTEGGYTQAYGTVLDQHSRKPDIIRDRIKQMYPHEKKIELFCRFPDPHFSSLGNEIDGLDITDALQLAAGGYYDLQEGAYRVRDLAPAAPGVLVRPGNGRVPALRHARGVYRDLRRGT